MNLLDPQQRRALAEQYVMGTMNESQQTVFALALARDAALRAEVADRHDKLLGIAPPAPPSNLAPARDLWRRIAVPLETKPQADHGHAVTVVHGVPRARPVWKRLWFWQGTSGLAVVTALALAAVLLAQRTAPTGSVVSGLTAPVQVAVLQQPQSKALGWLVEALPDGRLRLRPLAAATPLPPDQTLQLWGQRASDAIPAPLGLLKPGTPALLTVGPSPGGSEWLTFAVSQEPAGGSPAGRPTGPVLFSGQAVKG